MKLKRTDGGEQFEVEIVAHEGENIRVRIDGRDVEAGVHLSADGGAVIALGGRRFRVFGAKTRDSVLVTMGPASFEFEQVEEGRARGTRGLAAHEIVAPMPGKVLRIMVRDNDEVRAGDPILVLEAMKMETTLSAEGPARIKRVLVSEGQMVDHGVVMVELAPVNPDS